VISAVDIVESSNLTNYIVYWPFKEFCIYSIQLAFFCLAQTLKFLDYVNLRVKG